MPKKVPKKGAQIIKGAQGAQLSVTFQYHFVGIKHLVKLSSHFDTSFYIEPLFNHIFFKNGNFLPAGHRTRDYCMMLMIISMHKNNTFCLPTSIILEDIKNDKHHVLGIKQ